MTPLISVNKLSKSFPGVRALHEVQFDLAGGEALGGDWRGPRAVRRLDHSDGRIIDGHQWIFAAICRAKAASSAGSAMPPLWACGRSGWPSQRGMM